MSTSFRNELRSARLPRGPATSTVVEEAELASLPEPARRYLRRAGVVGRPRDWSFRLEWDGRFRMRRGGRWMPCRAWQYNSRVQIARVFMMTARFGGMLPLIARDTYVRGQGRMVGRLLDLFTVADGRGPELDAGELVTWLNDAVMLAPSMLLGPGVVWMPVDAGSFDVALTDGGMSVEARVSVDEYGAPVDFSTHDRFCYEPGRPGSPWVRNRWSTPIEGWRATHGRWVPVLGRAIWHSVDGPFVYAEFRPRPATLVFNEPPAD